MSDYFTNDIDLDEAMLSFKDFEALLSYTKHILQSHKQMYKENERLRAQINLMKNKSNCKRKKGYAIRDEYGYVTEIIECYQSEYCPCKDWKWICDQEVADE